MSSLCSCPRLDQWSSRGWALPALVDTPLLCDPTTLGLLFLQEPGLLGAISASALGPSPHDTLYLLWALSPAHSGYQRMTFRGFFSQGLQVSVTVHSGYRAVPASTRWNTCITYTHAHTCLPLPWSDPTVAYMPSCMCVPHFSSVASAALGMRCGTQVWIHGREVSLVSGWSGGHHAISWHVGLRSPCRKDALTSSVPP